MEAGDGPGSNGLQFLWLLRVVSSQVVSQLSLSTTPPPNQMLLNRNQAKIAFHIKNPGNENELNTLFDRIDKDHSGSIDRQELIKALEASGLKLSGYRVDAMMKAADENNDGSISREEFLHVFKSLHDIPHEGAPPLHEALHAPPAEHEYTQKKAGIHLLEKQKLQKPVIDGSDLIRK